MQSRYIINETNITSYIFFNTRPSHLFETKRLLIIKLQEIEDLWENNYSFLCEKKLKEKIKLLILCFAQCLIILLSIRIGSVQIVKIAI